MSKIHVMRFPMDDNFYEIRISIKSKPLCEVLNKYKDFLMEKLEITITDEEFTFEDYQYQSYVPVFPERIVAGLIDLSWIWSDCEYIPNSTAEQIRKELADNELLFSNSVYDMDWCEIHHKTVYDEDDCIKEQVTRKEASIHDGWFTYNSEDSRIRKQL